MISEAQPPPRSRSLRVFLGLKDDRSSALQQLLESSERYQVEIELAPESSPQPDLRELLKQKKHDLYFFAFEDLQGDLPLAGGSFRRLPIIAVAEEDPPLCDDDLASVDCLTAEDFHLRSLERVIAHTLDRASVHDHLRAVQSRFELILSAANDGLWAWDLKTDTLTYSPRCKYLLGLNESSEIAQLGPEQWFGQVHPDDVDGLQGDLQAHLDGRTPAHQFEHRVRQKDGTYRWVQSRGLVQRDTWGRTIQLAGSITDISERKRVESLLTHGSNRDALTGLASRRALVEKLDREIMRSKSAEQEYRYALLFINLDRFKVVNDSIGLESGDIILNEIGQRLCQVVGDEGLVCRYGGDEFAILLHELSSNRRAVEVADAVHEALRRSFDLDGHSVFTTASIGITLSSRNYDRASEAIRDAGVATSHAKRRGKSRTATFDTTMRVEAVNVLRLQNSLRQAVDNQEFEVHYQPVVNLSDRSLLGFEALVRWKHPRRGLVAPSEFIPLAEETGLIVPIGQYVLHQACRQISEWKRKYAGNDHLFVSVNISARQIGIPTLCDDIERILDESQLAASSLKVELTESTIIDDSDTGLNVLQRLHERGISLYVDDFGTGYSSLAYLHRIVIDGLKIDKSFVDMLGSPDRNSTIVSSIVGLAHNLDIGVIAEGVQTVQQANALLDLNCTAAQGYLYSKPLEAKRAEEIVARGTVAPPGST